MPEQLTPLTFLHLVNTVDTLRVCSGNPDDQFVDAVTSKKGVVKSKLNTIIAHLDTAAPVTCDGTLYMSTVRRCDCEILTTDVRCVTCKAFRPSLRKICLRTSGRSSSAVTDTTSHVNVRYMNTPEKREKISKMKRRVSAAEREVVKLQNRIETLTQEYGETVDEDFHEDLLSIMQTNSKQVRDAYPEGSFKRLFWEEQLRAATAKSGTQVRWHPMMIRWCLNLKLLSSSAYHALRTSGFVTLPSERTLRDYTNVFQSKTGFQAEVNAQLLEESKVRELPEEKKYCGLVIDEMKVKENLVYDKFTGAVTGFVSLGNINDELLELERQCRDEVNQAPMATHLLVLMVRGIFFRLQYPYAHFATRAITAEMLFPIAWEAIRQIEAIGLKVIFITADGASANRRFFKMHKGLNDSAPIYKTINIYSGPEKRPLFFYSDPPHLMKTTRNCWSHSGMNGTRLMTVSLFGTDIAAYMVYTCRI